MRIGAFELAEPLPELKEPHALATLRPWVDVGNVGTLTLSWLEAQTQADQLAKLARPGNFFDFTRYRPTLYRRGGDPQVVIPNTYINYSKKSDGNDFLFIHLLEPHMHGEDYIDSVVELMAKFGVKRYCLLGSMYDFVPHTRPLLVTGGASGKQAEQELSRAGIESSSYEGPTTIAYLISQQAPEVGIESMGLIVHLPQYTQPDEDYMGTARIMQILSSIYNIPVNEATVKKATQQLEQIKTAVERNPEVKAVVEQLEAHYDVRLESKEDKKPSHLSPEVERFLREMERRFRQG